MTVKSSILFSILSIVTLLAAGGIAGTFALLLIFAAATVFLVRMAGTTLAGLCRPLAPAYCRHKTRFSRRTPW